jgi:hypothetical protein
MVTAVPMLTAVFDIDAEPTEPKTSNSETVPKICESPTVPSVTDSTAAFKMDAQPTERDRVEIYVDNTDDECGEEKYEDYGGLDSQLRRQINVLALDGVNPIDEMTLSNEDDIMTWSDTDLTFTDGLAPKNQLCDSCKYSVNEFGMQGCSGCPLPLKVVGDIEDNENPQYDCLSKVISKRTSAVTEALTETISSLLTPPLIKVIVDCYVPPVPVTVVDDEVQGISKTKKTEDVYAAFTNGTFRFENAALFHEMGKRGQEFKELLMESVVTDDEYTQ